MKHFQFFFLLQVVYKNIKTNYFFPTYDLRNHATAIETTGKLMGKYYSKAQQLRFQNFEFYYIKVGPDDCQGSYLNLCIQIFL